MCGLHTYVASFLCGASIMSFYIFVIYLIGALEELDLKSSQLKGTCLTNSGC